MIRYRFLSIYFIDGTVHDFDDVEMMPREGNSYFCEFFAEGKAHSVNMHNILRMEGDFHE